MTGKDEDQKENDPTKDPAFQRVVQTFLNTPPKKREPKAPSSTSGKNTRGTGPKCD